MGKKRDFEPAFKGCVVVPLTDDDVDVERIRYYGDWYNKHQQITKKPRKYLLTFYLKGFNGERGVEQARIITRQGLLDLSHYIESEGNAMIAEIGKERVNLKASYVSIKA